MGRCFGLALVCVLGSTGAWAQGLVVFGEAKVPVTADVLEVRGALSSAAELPADAQKKLQQRRKRFETALGMLELESLEVLAGGPTVDLTGGRNPMAVMMMGAEADTQTDVPVSFREEISIRVAGVGALELKARNAVVARILAVCRDFEFEFRAGGQDRELAMMRMLMGQRHEPEAEPGPVTWTVAKPAEIERAALAEAVADATRRAGVRAELLSAEIAGVQGFETMEGARFRFLETPRGSHAVRVKITYRIK